MEGTADNAASEPALAPESGEDVASVPAGDCVGGASRAQEASGARAGNGARGAFSSKDVSSPRTMAEAAGRKQRRVPRDGPSRRQRSRAGKGAAMDAKDVYNRIQDGEGAFDAVADKVSDKVAERARIPVGPTGQAINFANDMAHRVGLPKSATDATQMVADAVPANFIQTAFGSSLRMLKGKEGVVQERDKWARGESGVPLQGFGQVSRVLQCKVRRQVLLFESTF